MLSRLSHSNGIYLTVLFVGGLLFLYSIQAAADQISATHVMRVSLDKRKEILSDEKLKQLDKARARLRWLGRIVRLHFDYKELAKRTLGSYWGKLSDTERDEFLVLFKQFLTKTYAGRIASYAGEKVHYLNERREGNFAEVKTKIVTGKFEIFLDYRLLKKSDQWRVYDVVVEGISLAKSYRVQFLKIIQNSSYQGLLNTLRQNVEPQ